MTILVRNLDNVICCLWMEWYFPKKERAVNFLTFSLNSLYIFFHWEVLIEIKRPKWEFLSFNAAFRRELFFFQSRVSRRNREKENPFSWLRVKKLSSACPSFSNYDHWHLTPPPPPPTTTTNKLFLQQQIPAQINQLRFLPFQQRTNSSSIFTATDENDIYDNDENTKMMMRRIMIALGVLTEGCCKVGFCSILASNSSAAAGYTMNKGATEFDQIIMESNINWTICCKKKNTKIHSYY